MEINVNKHISGQFNEELEQIRNDVLKMGGLVEQQLTNALNAVNNSDTALARQVLENDYLVNRYEVEIDASCTRIIAKRQPAASDLRLVLAIIKTITDLERIGDEAERIANVALESFNKAQQEFLVSMDNMGRKATHMLNDVLDAFARMDPDAAIKAHDSDKLLDKEYEAITRQLMTYMMEDPRAIPKVLDVLWSVRSLERIGDRCKNIAEYIIYFVKGKDVRHTSVADIKDNILS